MQTFLPVASFQESAKILDYRRLGKQRIEARTLAQGMWKTHPAAKMWQGHFHALCVYGMHMCNEWIARSYDDNTFDEFAWLIKGHEPTGYPPWFGNEAFHASHRSNLLRKDPVYYGQFGWTESPDLEYIWPIPL